MLYVIRSIIKKKQDLIKQVAFKVLCEYILLGGRMLQKFNP